MTPAIIFVRDFALSVVVGSRCSRRAWKYVEIAHVDHFESRIVNSIGKEPAVRRKVYAEHRLLPTAPN
jgi:hypothetical protein